MKWQWILQGLSLAFFKEFLSVIRLHQQAKFIVCLGLLSGEFALGIIQRLP